MPSTLPTSSLDGEGERGSSRPLLCAVLGCIPGTEGWVACRLCDHLVVSLGGNACRVLAGLLAVSVATALTGCATTLAPVGPGSADPAAQAQKILTTVLTQVHGSAHQRLAAVNHEGQVTARAFRTCMARYGQNDTQVAAVDKVPLNPASYITPGDLTAFAPVDIGTIANLVPRAMAYQEQRQNLHIPAITDPVAKASYLGAMAKCPDGASTGSGDAHAALEGPLDRKLITLMAKVQDEPAIRTGLAAYGPCMQAAGFNSTDWESTGKLVYGQVAALPDRVDVTKDPAWRAALAFETRIAATDSDCRRDLHQKALAAALPDLQQFQSDNADDLAQAADQWAALAAGE
jgi:hypothetical protein